MNNHHDSNDIKNLSHSSGEMSHGTETDKNKKSQNKHNDHNKHAGHNTEAFLTKFIISSVVTIPVLALSDMVQQFFGFSISFSGDKYVLGILATFIFGYGGMPFIKGLWKEIKNNNIGMMTLIGVAITAAWSYSFAVTLGLKGMDFYWEMATLIDIMLLGHWLEMRSVISASESVRMLAELMPSEAHLVLNGSTKDVPVKALKKDDVVSIKPGEKVPVDGVVIEGESHLDESMLTGESKPVKKQKDDKVIGGSVNGNGVIQVRVVNTGEESYLKKVIDLVEDAQKIKSKTQNLADRAAKILTFIALGGGLVTLLIWLLLGFEFVYALERMVTVMVISCPHALGLAVPLVAAISTTMSAKRGFLIRNRTAFENARKITTVVFDKTGTLTKGTHEVSNIRILNDEYDENQLLSFASALEQHSEHYIASGIMKKAKSKSVDIPESEKFNSLTGRGIEGIVRGKEIKVVGPNYLKENNLDLPSENEHDSSATLVYVLISGKPAGIIYLEDQIRDESFDSIRTLKEKGLKNLLLTGDNENVARHVAHELKMDEYMANVLPDEKQKKIKELQDKGEFVAMTGDGVNDAPALAKADVGIAVGSGTDIAAETADIILVNSNPKDISDLILFGTATYKKMVQNLFWAAGYNIAAIPLAAGVLYNFGIVLNPAIGAALMSLSTILVAINAQLLRKKL